MSRYTVKAPSRGGARKGAGRKPGSKWDEKTRRLRNAFSAQKCNAKIRGIDWQFTLEEYITWWGDDFDRRGRTKESLVMARYGDIGPYHPDNVYKATPYQNIREANLGKKRSDEFRELKRQQAIAQHAKRKEIKMQIPVTPQPGQTPRQPNIVNRDDYKMHILKRQYADGEYEILIERWIPETGWTRTQILCDKTELDKITKVLTSLP